jgi:AsmA protein
MACRRFGFCLGTLRRWSIALGALAVPPALWAIFLAVIPTDCARQKIAERLSRASGRNVTLGRVRLGALGGVYLTDLTIGAPRSNDDPWFQAKEAAINVNLLQLLLGQIDPTEIEVRGLDLRIHRRSDGTLELADLLRSAPSSQNPQNLEPSATSEPAGLSVRVRQGSVWVIDEPSRTRLNFTQIEGRGTCKGPLARVDELRGILNGGPFELAGQLDRSGPEASFEGQIRLRQAALCEGMSALGYVVPVLAGLPAQLDGKLSLDIYVQGRGRTHDAVLRSLVGHGRVSLDPIALDGSQLLAGIGTLLEQEPQRRVGAIRSDMTIKGGRVATDNLTLDVARTPIVLVGWTDFGGQVNYRLRTDRISQKLPTKAKALLSDLSVDLRDLADIKIQGTLNSLAITVDGVAVPGPNGEPVRRLDDRERLREVGRRLLDRVRR